MSRADKFAAVTSSMLDTYKRKNADYGNSFDESIDEHGDIAFVVRADDKMRRIKQLHKQAAQVSDESMRDTVADLANYCVMWLMREQGERDVCATCKHEINKTPCAKGWPAVRPVIKCCDWEGIK